MTFRNTKHPNSILQEDVQPLLPIKEDKRNNSQPDESPECYKCDSNKLIKYVNCCKGGLQNELYGKWKEICAEQAICFECRDKSRDKCPFCKNHKLFAWTKGCGPKKKAPFAIREEKRLKKIAKKKKEAEKKLRREEREIQRLLRINRDFHYKLSTHRFRTINQFAPH